MLIVAYRRQQGQRIGTEQNDHDQRRDLERLSLSCKKSFEVMYASCLAFSIRTVVLSGPLISINPFNSDASLSNIGSCSERMVPRPCNRLKQAYTGSMKTLIAGSRVFLDGDGVHDSSFTPKCQITASQCFDSQIVTFPSESHRVEATVEQVDFIDAIGFCCRRGCPMGPVKVASNASSQNLDICFWITK